MIYVICLMGNGLVQVEQVSKLVYSSIKPYAIKWIYTKDINEVEKLKKILVESL